LHVHVFRKTDNAPIAIPIAGDYPLRQSCNWL
jgi:hypothetical protein